jgi:hypothetical protein
MSTVLFLAAVVLVIGWFRGWVSFTKSIDTGDENKANYGVSINKEGAHEDAEKLAKKAHQAVGKADLGSSAKGTIASLDQGQGLVVRTVDNKSVDMNVDSSTRVTLNDRPAGLTDLRSGDPVTVAYSTKDDKKVATTITAKRNQ